MNESFSVYTKQGAKKFYKIFDDQLCHLIQTGQNVCQS